MRNNLEPRRVRQSANPVVGSPVSVASLVIESPKRHNRRWKRVGGIVAIVLAVVFSIYVTMLVINVAKVSTVPFSFTRMADDGKGRTNLLLLGEGDDAHAGKGLTDTIILMSANKLTSQTSQVSVPRDIRVAISGYGDGKINSANALGGVPLAEQTVSNTLGVPVNYYALTNFSGMAAVIDSVGGLEVNVTERLYDTEYPCDNDQYKVCGLDIQPGLQHMDGATALKYIRCRKGTCGNDYGRAQRQQEIINLLLGKIMMWQTLLNPWRLIPLTNSLSGALQTNMGGVQMGEFGFAWLKGQKHSPIGLVLSTFPGNYLMGDRYSSDLLPIGGTFEAIQNRAQNIFTMPAQPSDIPQ